MSDDDAKLPDAWIEFGATFIYDLQRAGILYKIDDMTARAVCHLTDEDATWYDFSPGQYRQWLSTLPHGASAATIAATLTNPPEFARCLPPPPIRRN